MRTGVFFRYVVMLVALVFIAAVSQAQESNPLAVSTMAEAEGGDEE